MMRTKGKAGALSLLLALALLPGGAWAGSHGLLRGGVPAGGHVLAGAEQQGLHAGSVILARGRPHHRSPRGHGHGFRGRRGRSFRDHRGHGFQRRGFRRFQHRPFFYFGAPGFIPGLGIGPGPGWIGGHWQWTDWGWIWVPGHWARRGW
jgi:hypothetical protein